MRLKPIILLPIYLEVLRRGYIDDEIDMDDFWDQICGYQADDYKAIAWALDVFYPDRSNA